MRNQTTKSIIIEFILKSTLKLSQNKFKLIKYCGERKTENISKVALKC